ncbi:MAG: HD domain-containing protein [Lachnospiraceae bacterium]|nr:HD domain-containing protein [Lachnospiraceae bacterium]
MKVRLFAAIDIGSFELSCKIFEFTSKNGMKEIENLRYRLDLGGESFANGKISGEKVDELCHTLLSFRKIMELYQVEAYKAYGTSAIRETQNRMILLDQIEQRTGIKIEVISNSEQRFLNYKAIASRGEEFNKIIEKGTAILDIGGGSIQLSLFDKDTLVATQNLKIGVFRLEEQIRHLAGNNVRYEELLDEYISSQLSVFKKLYLKDRIIENIIVVDDYVSSIMQKFEKEGAGTAHLTYDEFVKFLGGEKNFHLQEQAKRFGISEDNMAHTFVSSVIIKRCMKTLGADHIWSPGVVLCDGIGYEYGEKKGLLTEIHDFRQDIIACAHNISKRYQGNKKRSETLESIALTIFDSMKKIHGLGKRERLLLQLATILHDCGKYISMVNLGECSYNIILYTEIIGISHIEREIVANVVKFNHEEFTYFDILTRNSLLEKNNYMVIAKLTAILKLANALDRSQKQKFKDIKVALKEHILSISVVTDEDITLEQGLLRERADFFEEVYSIKPVIKQKKSMII